MHRRPKVAIVADARRQDAVGHALYLLQEGWPNVPANGVVLKPNLVSHHDLRASSHPTTVGAVADFLYARGAQELVIAEGASDATAGFEQLGHRRMFWCRPVQWFDINRDETRWRDLALRGTNGTMRTARLSETMAGAGLFVSVALAKTHVNTMLTASMKNLMSCLHPQDRIQMHGYASGGNGYTGLKKQVVDWLRGDSTAIAWATTAMGRARQAVMLAQRATGRMRWEKLSTPQREFLKSISAMHTNLVRLNQAVGPRLAVVDGFSAMDGEGPRFGRSRNLGWVVAGTDPVAVDSVVARLMGLDVNDIGYLVLAQQAGFGTTRLDEIDLVGDPIEKLSRRCRKHSQAPLQNLWQQALPAISEPACSALPAAGSYRPNIATAVRQSGVNKTS